MTAEDHAQLNSLDRGEKGRSFDYLKIFQGYEIHTNP